jgi:hypothetical protein
MLNSLKFLWRSYSKRPPKAIPKKPRKKPSISSTPNENSLPNKESSTEANSPLSLKFQEFIKNQKIEDLSHETKEKLANSASLDKISKSLFIGQVIDLGGLHKEFSGEVEEFEKGFGGQEDTEMNEMLEKIAEDMKKEQGDDIDEKMFKDN